MKALDRAGAHRRAQRVRDGVAAIDDVIETLIEIQERQDWLALGYKSWSEYCEGEFGPAKLKLTAEQRGRVVAVLASSGMSKRRVALALGVSEGTVRNDVKRSKGAQNYALPNAEPQVNDEQTAAGAATPPADDEHNRASTAGSSAAGPADFPAAGPAVTPNHPAAPGDAADNPTAAGAGDEAADEEASPSTSEAAAHREQQEPSAGVSEPAAPATGRPVPAYIGKSLALFEAVYDLIQEDSAGVGEIIADDLAEHVIAATASLAKWVKGMQDSFDSRDTT